MSVTLLALYKRPEGGDEALATFWRRYSEEHLPLIEQVPGLRGSKVWDVARRYTGEDFVGVTEMYFDDMDALKTAMRSAEMAAAGKVITELAGPLMTLVALEEQAA
jgi:uncharacterized protein (TIGR02118 family)